MIFVDPGAAAGGDGSEAAPWQSLTHALTEAPRDAVIALARGRHQAVVRPDRTVTLLGACPEETIIEGHVSSGLFGVIRSDQADVEVRNLTVRSDVRPGITVGDGAVAKVVGVIVDGARSLGLAVYRDGRLEGDHVVVRNVARSPDGTSGRGATVEVRGQLQLSHAAIADVHDQGLFVAGAGSSATLADVAIVRVEPEADGQFGRGVAIESGAQLQAERLVVEEARQAGLFVLSPGTEVDLETVVVRSTRTDATGAFGRGLSVNRGASLTARRTWVHRNHDVGVYAFGEATMVRLEDVVVSHTAPQDDDTRGRGVSIESGATLTGARIELRDNRELGGLIFGASAAELDDVRVARTEPRVSDGAWGRGLWVHEGTHLALTRAVLDENHDAALMVSPGAELRASDVTVRGTRGADLGDQAAGFGLRMLPGDGGVATCERCLFADNLTGGVLMNDGPRLRLVDTVVRDTRPRGADGFGGLGIALVNGAALEVERVRFSGNRGTALFAAHAGTTVAGSDLSIEGTRANEPGPLRLFGRAFDLQEGATAQLARVRFEDNETAGLLVSASVADLEDLAVSRTRADPESGRGGRGVITQDGGDLTIRRGHLGGNREVGLYVSESSALLEDIHIEDTTAVECRGEACFGLATGIGLGVYRNSEARMSRFVLADNEILGLHLAVGGVLDAAEGVVSGSLIGANVSTEGFDLTRISQSVAYIDNGRNLDTDELPVPESGQTTSPGL